MPFRSLQLLVACLLVALTATADAVAIASEPVRPVTLRVRWGGGAPQAWNGRIELPSSAGDAAPSFTWRTLSSEPDAAALAHEEAGGIVVHQPRPIVNDGVEITVSDWAAARIRVSLGPASGGATAGAIDLPVAEILAGPQQRPLDGEGNRLVVEQAVGDALRVEFATAVGATAPLLGDTVRRPGDRVRLRVSPLLLLKPGSEVELRVRLTAARQDAALESLVIPLKPVVAPAGDAAGGGPVPTGFRPADCELTLPTEEGGYDIALEAVERRGLRWNRQLATRRLQLVAIAAEPQPRIEDEPWKLVYDLDPASPRLHERLRRLPARGLQQIPRPNVSLPAMPLPSLSRPAVRLPDVPLPALPSVPMPSMPAMPSVPGMPSLVPQSMPTVSSLVPRLGGLLASGHSAVAPHPLGPMLSLPPASSTASPSWEGIVIANARPGYPHAVEIDYPTDHPATLGIAVLEGDAAGGGTEVRHAGGVEVASTPHDEPARIATHRFVFWPTTRQPLVVLANPVTSGPALVGRVRVLAGPARLPAAPSPAAVAARAAQPRQTFALLPDANLTRAFGGGLPDADTGRQQADWAAHLTALRHSADALLAQGLAGGVLTVYSGGVAAWPSRLTRSTARWPTTVGTAAVEHDLLAAAALVYAREGLTLLPALAFDGAVPALELIRTGPEATGIACVGADGRPRRLPGGVHYNVLDPRVQEAVESIVAEAAGRLRNVPGVAGLAIVLPHDGWIHLPGIAWGLDDATFARFLAASGAHEPAADADAGETRHAARAALVAGPLREAWLAWRDAELGAFHARLAAAAVADDDRRQLFIVPTTLFAAGDLAVRFRPSLTGAPANDGLLREIGLATSPAAAEPARQRIVLVPPSVHAPGLTLADRSAVAAANLTVAFPDQARQAAAILEQPLAVNLAEIVPHSPFPTASPPPPTPLRIVRSTADGDRALAESLARSDAEVVFDARPLVVASAPPLRPRGHEPLPAERLDPLADVPEPLVVRTRALDGVTWVQLANAGPAPARAVLRVAGSTTLAIDARTGETFPLEGGRLAVPLAAWDVRPLVIDGTARVEAASIEYAEPIRATVAGAIERLRQRLAVLAAPAALDVLDNPGFELGPAEAKGTAGAPVVTGWELLEPRRGSLAVVPGRPGPAGSPRAVAAGDGRAIEFASRNGLSTLRSNPFPPPATGRVSVAAWLRLKPDDPQPPLRMAIEGVEGSREYYRFAAVGGLTGDRPLTGEWSLFVLQVDDLPTGAVESLRVRFDLLGPGSVEIDDVRVFDLAFEETQRAEMARQLARIDHRFKAGDLGAALTGLDGHWPAFLETFVSDTAVAALAREQERSASEAATAPVPPEPRQGMLDRWRGWWQ